MSATNTSRTYRKFKRAANSRLKKAGSARRATGSTIDSEDGIGPWWLGAARSEAKKIRREAN
jgi:hypothetical protein